ncbi:MAG: hypothetical protein LUH63_03270 [Parabacteroides sp.]|nr:hypothetical protein [Parabacteroides sp.]
MDKELPESELGLTPRKAEIRVSKSYLPGSKSYKANVTFRRTIDIEAIAERIVDKRSEFRKETFVTTFNIIKKEIYEAIEDGFNVDFGFGRTEITINGPFESVGEKFNRKKHTLTPCLRPSPQLKQRTARIPAENISYGVFANAPRPAYVSLRIEPRTSDSTEPYNQLPAGPHHFISIYGDRLRLMGDLPGVGVLLRCVETDEEHFYTADEMLVNTTGRLCFVPGFDFTPGEWEATVGSQYTPTYHLYKQERYGYLTFTVV